MKEESDASVVDFTNENKCTHGEDSAGHSKEASSSGGRGGAMAGGCAMALLGVILTAVSYGNASRGGRYSIFWGLVIFGGITFFKGLLKK